MTDETQTSDSPRGSLPEEDAASPVRPSLSPDLLDELREAEAGGATPLLDEQPLAGDDPLLDDSRLGPQQSDVLYQRDDRGEAEDEPDAIAGDLDNSLTGAAPAPTGESPAAAHELLAPPMPSAEEVFAPIASVEPNTVTQDPLLAPAPPPRPLTIEGMDASLVADREDESIAAKAQDDLLTTQGATGVSPPPHTPAAPAPPENEAGKAPEENAARQQIGSENLAAAASSSDIKGHDLSQEDLDEILDKAKHQGLDVRAIRGESETSTEAAAAKEAPRKDRSVLLNAAGRWAGAHAARVLAAALAGILATSAMYVFLWSHQELAPDMARATNATPLGLDEVVSRASTLIEREDYTGALALLEPAIAKADSGPLRTEAEYLALEARVRGFVYEPANPEYEVLQSAIDELVTKAPAHARAPEALYWKAKLYELDEVPYGAQGVYGHLIESYPDAKDLDTYLFEASKLALSIRDPSEAARYTQRLRRDFPGSPHAAEARLLLGDAYAMAGMQNDARTLFVLAAEEAPGTAVAGKAVVRLGTLLIENGQYEDAVRQTENHLRTALTTEGNGEIYLILAQGYRQLGKYTEAENALNDLLNFLPESEITPLAYVELSQVLEAKGMRDEAMRVAGQAAKRYPGNPTALKNHGNLLGLAGNALAAAETLLAAEEAGANDPSLLLSAARYYNTAGDFANARAAYAKLKRYYPRTGIAFTGEIEDAELLYKLGRINESVQQLEDVSLAMHGNDRRFEALRSLARIYKDLGITDRVIEVSEELAASASDPSPLAEAAIALIEAGALDSGQQVYERIDRGALDDKTAYRLDFALGTALLNVDPRRALDTMEGAQLAFPRQRTLPDDLRMLDAYLAGNRPAAARRLVMEIDAHVREEPVDTAYLAEAATRYGDFLYRRGDYRAAADVFDMAIQAATKTAESSTGNAAPDWIKFQRANALLQLSEFEDCIALYDEVAASGALWAEEAGEKAAYARLEQRRRNAPSLRVAAG